MDSDLYQNTLDVLPQKDRLKITKQIRQRQVENYIKFTKADSVEVQPRKQNKKKCSVNFDPNYCVQEAIESCDDLQVLKLIKGGFDPNFTTGNGISLLHKCCLEGNVIVAEILISMGADVNVQDNDWWTPLHVSCHRDNPELVQLLLSNGSDASVLDVDGNFPIDHAPAKSESYYIMCNHLTEQGYQSSVLTELRASAGILVKFEIEGFINHNVDVSKPLFDGITWLHIVCANGYRKALGLLLQHAADVNAVDFNGLTPLHVAAKFNQKQVVEVLLKNDARTDILDVHGFRPMDVAASEEIQRIILNDHRQRHQSSVSSEQFEDEEEDEVFVSKVVRPPELPLSKAEKLMEAQIRFQYMEDGKTSKDRCEDKHDDEDCEYVNTILQVQPSKEANLPSTGPSDDLVNFGVISDKLILDTLSERYKFNKIYTNIGDMLIAVNPLQVIPHYSKEICHTYHNECKLRRLPPHIYASGEQSLREMNTARTSQCCVIGGESGSGKTESCKLIVQHLIEVSNCIDNQLSHKINQINPLLEAFGNAQTVLNDNSSRYAKFLELKYCSEGRILLGASLSEYLLEKCRVVKQGEEELNFHIFYWMLAGLTPEECRSSFIDKKQHYRYLGNDLAKMAKHMTLDNKQKFWEVKQCLKFIGFTQDDVMSVISILAAILHLGNITFGKNEDDYAIFTNEEPLKKASILLHIPFEDLYSALIQDVIITAGEQTTIYLTEIQAVDSCDALAKTLYSRLFSWIVNGINQMVQPQEASCDDKLSISILDLFGFENLQQNSFEQMCINVANEQLQLYFNEHVFKNEEEDCVLEGIPRLNLTLPWNDQAISLFMERGCGILALLDEECSFPKSTDKSLAHKLHQGPGQKYKAIYKTPRDGGIKFTAVHYAGAITYSVEGILEKNRDKLRPYLSTTVRSSTNLLFRDLFNTRLSKTGSLTTSVRQKSIKHKSKLLSGLFNAKKVHRGRVGRGEKPFTKKQPATMAYHFRNSLKDLMNKVSCCKSHFIRCIKPNTEKKPDLFVAEYVQSQLKYTGVLETVQIRKNGYSMRIRFIDFLVRYKCLHAVQSFPFSKNKNREIVWCKEILGRWKIVGYKMGKTKLFLHLTDSERLDAAEKYCLRMIWKCQAMIRGYYVRKKLIIRHSKRERNMSHIEVLGSLINTNQDRIYQYQVELNEQDILRFSNSQQNEEDTTLNYLDNILDQEPLYVNIPTKEKNNNERPESELISDISCVDTLYEMFESSSELSTCNLPSETTYQEVTAHYEVPSDTVTDSMNSQPGYLPSHHSGHHPSQHPGYSPSTCEIVDQNARNYPPSPKEMYSSNLYEDMRGHNNNRSLEKIPPVLPHRSPETRLSTSTGTSSRGSSISEPDINQGLYQDSHYSTPSPPISPAKKHPHHPSNQQYGNQPFSYVPNAAVLHQHERQTHSEYIQQDYCNGAMDNTDNVYASYIPNDDHIQQSYHGQRPTNQKHMIIGNSVKKMSSPVLSHKKYPFQNGPNGTSGSPKLRRASEGQTEVYQGQKPKGKNVGSPKLPLKFHQKSVSVDGQSSVPPPPNFPAPPPPLHVQDRYLAGANSSRCPSPPLPPPPPEYQSGSVVKPPCSAPLPPPVSTIPGRQPRPQEVVDQRPPRSSSHSRSNSGVESAAIIQELGTIKLKSRNHSSGSNGGTCTSNSNSASQNNDNNELGRIQLKKTKTERIGDIYQPVDAKPSPAPTTSSLTAGIIPICDIDDFPLPPLPEELLTATPTVIPPAPQSPIVKQAPSPPKSPLVKHSPPAPILPKSQINSIPSQTVSTKSSIVTQIPTTPISPTVTPLNGHSKPKETINARMDFEIPADIDLSQCPGLVPTPPHCPIWKKEMIDKKNKDRVEEYVRDILRDREEQEKWKNVPEWKRKVLKQKSDEARTKEKSVKEGGAPLPPPDQKTTQSELLHAGQTRYDDDFVPAAMNIDPEEFENMPPWKQELLTKRKNIPVTFNNEFNPDEPDKSPHESYDLDVKMAS